MSKIDQSTFELKLDRTSDLKPKKKKLVAMYTRGTLTCSRGTLRGLLSDTSALYSSFSSATSDPLAADKIL